MSRHYVYISRTTVDMYVGQVTPRKAKKVFAELSFNLGVIKGKIATDRDALPDPMQRLELAERCVRADNTVRGMGSAANWIDDRAPMSCLRLAENEGLMFYIAEKDHHVFAMGGSAAHMLGRAPTSRAGATWITHSPDLLEALGRVVASTHAAQADATRKDLRRALHVGVSDRGKVAPWTKLLDEAAVLAEENPKQQLQFLARVLHTQSWALTGKRYTLAAPLYIALADV